MVVIGWVLWCIDIEVCGVMVLLCVILLKDYGMCIGVIVFC